MVTMVTVHGDLGNMVTIPYNYGQFFQTHKQQRATAQGRLY